MNIEEETKHIQRLLDKGNFHAAYNIALSALNDRRKHKDQPGVDHFIDVIRGIVDSLAHEFGSKGKN